MHEAPNSKPTQANRGEHADPLGFHFAEEPRVVSMEMMASTSEWISNPNTKEWDYDQD
ncbi:MAG: hypothetical protein WDZ75_02050 [Candidatus Paceibacterota bacterium]